MRVLVTGVTGFVGRSLAHTLRDAGVEVFGTHLGPPPVDGTPSREVDVRDESAVRALVGDVDPDAVVHLAALSHVGASWSTIADYYEVNLLGADHLFRSAGDRRVVFASSAEVYGVVPASEQPISEDRSPRPASPYALTKAAAERLAIARGAVVARSFNLVGAGQEATFALPSFARQLAAIAVEGREPRLAVGNLAARRDFVAVEDGARALALLCTEGRRGETYNVSSGVAHSMAELLDLLIARSGQSVSIETDPDRLRPVDVPLLLGRNDRLRALGWTPRVGLDAAIDAVWQEALTRA